MALPTVTAKDLHSVQLSPQLRKMLHRRAQGANRREYAPVLAADRASLGAIKGQYRTQAASARNASGMVENALSRALAGLKSSGLHGGYLKQATREITSRQGDTAAALPFLLADAQESRNKELLEGRQQLLQDRSAMQQGTASDFDQLLKETRGQGSSLEAKRATERKKKAEEAAEPGGGKYDPLNLEAAKLELRNALAEWKKNPVVSVKLPDGSTAEKHLQEINPLRSREDWNRFAKGLADNTTGFDIPELNHVIQQLLQNRIRTGW